MMAEDGSCPPEWQTGGQQVPRGHGHRRGQLAYPAGHETGRAASPQQALMGKSRRSPSGSPKARRVKLSSNADFIRLPQNIKDPTSDGSLSSHSLSKQLRINSQDSLSKKVKGDNESIHTHSSQSPTEHSEVSSNLQEDIALSPIMSLPDDPTLNNILPGPMANGRTMTMTGTIKRGKKASDIVEVKLELTQSEIERMNRSSIMVQEEKSNTSICGLRKGPHVLLLSILFLPCALLSSLAIAFYMGTMCWYNIYLYLSEECTIWHRIFLCPLLIIFYPVLVVFFSLLIALYAAPRQLSWFLSRWLKEIRDLEKGFFGWLCNKLGLPECSPYEIVILQEDTSIIGQPPSNTQTML